jgi:hypothetical protein
MVQFLRRMIDGQFEKPLFKTLEYAAMLVMQVLNKVVTEHRYPFSSFMLQNNFIPTVAELARLRSKLLDTEILKFFKALHRSKD